MNNLLNKSKLFLKRNSSTVLTVTGSLGVIGTAVMAVKATPKAMLLLQEAEEEKGERLTVTEKAMVAAPVYIPAALVGVTTIACIFGANALNKRNQASMMSAYALLDSTYKQYKNKVDELYGEEAGANVRESIAKDNYKEANIVVPDGKKLFYDYYSARYFESTEAIVLNAEYQVNRSIRLNESAYLNDYYNLLGLEPLSHGYDYGWTPAILQERHWQEWVDFEHELVTMDDGLECTIITIQQEPVADFVDFY